jgi:hypothetical protein
MSELKLRPPFLCKLLRLRPKPPVGGAQAKMAVPHEKRTCFSGLLHADYEVSVCDVTVGHARSVEGEARIAFAVEKDEAAGGVSARGEDTYGLASGERRDIGR